MEINKLFVANAYQSGQKMGLMTKEMHLSTIEMEDMTRSTKVLAEKTEKQTTSMHIITGVTLVFLPGTFVAVRYGLQIFCSRKFMEFLTNNQTFFSSGSFQWDQNNAKSGDMPYWKPEFFLLFAKVCFPMTGVIMLLWFGAYQWARWREWRRRTMGDEENQRLSEETVPETKGKIS